MDYLVFAGMVASTSLLVGLLFGSLVAPDEQQSNDGGYK